MADELILRTVGLTKVLGAARVLRGVDAVFDRGPVHVIEGPNGAGKSTLLSLLGGRIRPTAGRVLLQVGRELGAEGGDLRRRCGWLGHDLGLYADLDPYANIALHARLRGLDAEAAWKDISEELGIAHLRGRKIREMSRGQRQRVALGRTLLGAPDVLLLDEPSTGLDVAAVERLAKLLVGVANKGTIVLTVTHDVPFAAALAGRYWALREGKLARLEGR